MKIPFWALCGKIRPLVQNYPVSVVPVSVRCVKKNQSRDNRWAFSEHFSGPFQDKKKVSRKGPVKCPERAHFDEKCPEKAQSRKGPTPLRIQFKKNFFFVTLNSVAKLIM